VRTEIYLQDALEGIEQLADASVQCCVTSPPYYKLRDYGIAGQLGQEATPDDYIQKLVKIFGALKAKLKKDGTLWCNLGDTYVKKKDVVNADNMTLLNRGMHYKAKDLMGIPWAVAFALRADGWYLRQDIIWHKPNPMPESVTDRCTKAHEYIFLLSLSPNYYFDQAAIRTSLRGSSVARLSQNVLGQKGSARVEGKTNGRMKAVYGKRKPRTGIDTNGGNQGKGNIPIGRDGRGFIGHSGNLTAKGELFTNGFANKRSVWTIPTKPSFNEHYAAYPEALAADCILAGSRPGDLILDPFVGSGTTVLVAALLEREFLGFDINPRYIKLAKKRLKARLGMFYPDGLDE